MTIKEHLVDVPFFGGSMTVIDTHRKNRPANLKKPYEYILPQKDVDMLVDELQAILKPHMGWTKRYSKTKTCQYASINKVALAHGVRLDLFILAHARGLTGPVPSTSDKEQWEGYTHGVKKTEWDKLRKDIQAVFFKYLGKDARIYAEPFSKDKKFQAVLRLYIAYK